MDNQLLCESCKKHYLRSENNVLFCPNPACTFCDKNPLTYENDINAYDAEDKVMNRFSQIYTPLEAAGENQRIECSNLESNIFRGKKFIFDCGHTLRLSENICGEALALLSSILRALEKEKQGDANASFDTEGQRESDQMEEDKKKEKGKEKGKGKGKGQRYKNKNIFSVRYLAAYSLQAICFEKQNYFEEYNIIKEFRITLKEWRDVNKQMNSLLRPHLSFVPLVHPKHIVLKICKKRHINPEEQAAMVEMCQRIAQYSNADVRSHTIAAIAFWKVCQFSKRYHNRIDLRHVCKNHDRLIERGLANKTYSFFDITPENVKKVYKQYIRAGFQWKYLPEWEGRMEVQDKDGNWIDYD